MMMSLYKIKIPQQILHILKKYVDKKEPTTLTAAVVGEAQNTLGPQTMVATDRKDEQTLLPPLHIP